MAPPGGVSGSPLRLYSTLARGVVNVELPTDRAVRIYTCGPTVYRPVHLGNLRSYLLADGLRRLLLALGYSVRQVKNITDVGHMRQELLDRGEDKMVAEALRAGETPQQIAARYTDAFFIDERRLNILPADVFPRATDHVPRMVEIAASLVDAGRAYERGGNVYFRVSRFGPYGELGGAVSREGLRQGVRVETDPLKEDPRDFALWKAAEPGRQALVWDSPWGRGFPGWHIECTAMATQHLGAQLDIHTGGVDNIFPHHEDERAQSEAFTGCSPFARVWLHGQHLLADGVKMAKSTGNAYTLDDLIALGFEPLAFRHLCLTADYRARLNFTFTSLRAAQRGLRRLRAHAAQWGEPGKSLGPRADDIRRAFWASATDDLGLPQCLAIAWSLARGANADLDAHEKATLAKDFERLLGLGLGTPPDARAPDRLTGAISSPSAIPDRSQDPDACQVSANLLVQAGEDLQAVARCAHSILQHTGDRAVEVVLVDTTGSPDAHATLARLATEDPRLRLLWMDHDPGAGAGRNAGLRASRGRFVALLDACVELVGDALGPVLDALERPGVGAAGPFGLVTADMRHYYEVDLPRGAVRDVDALQNYMLVFRRADLPRIGWLDERFRFYRGLDLDLSYAIRDRIGRAVSVGGLPITRRRHTLWEALGPAEREIRSRHNFGHFLRRWDARRDLLRVGAGTEVAPLETREAAVHG